MSALPWFRGIGVLAVTALAAGALAVAPATGATKFLTKKKAKKLFHTKAVADARFVRLDQSLSKGVTRSEFPFVPITTLEEEFIDLHTLHEGATDERLTLPFPSRIMASAVLTLHNSTIGTVPHVACRLTLTEASGTTTLGVGAPAGIPVGNGEVNVPLLGSVVRPPGQYDVSVICEEGTNTGFVSLSDATLVVWALPA